MVCTSLIGVTLISNFGCHGKDGRHSDLMADNLPISAVNPSSPFDGFPATSVEWGDNGLLKGISSHSAFDNTAALELSNYPSLEYLTLLDSPLSDAGVECLTGLQKLSMLSLSGTKITSNCIPSIAKIKSLTYLDLSRTNIDGSSVQSLVALKSIKSLIVSNTLLTREDIEVLRKEMPSCQIEQ
jgi:Leucine-rich repeat (LRR) protein